MGLAPIDHEVTVVGVNETEINIETSLTFETGWNLEECQLSINKVLNDYYKELNSLWSKENGLLVRISQIESRLLNVQGVVDIAGTKLNGTASNIMLDSDSVAVRGSFAVA